MPNDGLRDLRRAYRQDRDRLIEEGLPRATILERLRAAYPEMKITLRTIAKACREFEEKKAKRQAKAALKQAVRDLVWQLIPRSGGDDWWISARVNEALSFDRSASYYAELRAEYNRNPPIRRFDCSVPDRPREVKWNPVHKELDRSIPNREKEKHALKGSGIVGEATQRWRTRNTVRFVESLFAQDRGNQSIEKELSRKYDEGIGREYLDCEGIHRISYHTGDGWCVFELDTENHDMLLSFPCIELEYCDSDDDPTEDTEPINRCLQLEDTDQISMIRHYL